VRVYRAGLNGYVTQCDASPSVVRTELETTWHGQEWSGRSGQRSGQRSGERSERSPARASRALHSGHVGCRGVRAEWNPRRRRRSIITRASNKTNIKSGATLIQTAAAINSVARHQLTLPLPHPSYPTTAFLVATFPRESYAIEFLPRKQPRHSSVSRFS